MAQQSFLNTSREENQEFVDLCLSGAVHSIISLPGISCSLYFSLFKTFNITTSVVLLSMSFDLVTVVVVAYFHVLSGCKSPSSCMQVTSSQFPVFGVAK